MAPPRLPDKGWELEVCAWLGRFFLRSGLAREGWLLSLVTQAQPSAWFIPPPGNANVFVDTRRVPHFAPHGGPAPNHSEAALWLGDLTSAPSGGEEAPRCGPVTVRETLREGFFRTWTSSENNTSFESSENALIGERQRVGCSLLSFCP